MTDDTIRVRLSPEGQAQVREAFRQVERDSARSSKAAAGGVASITRSIAGLRRTVTALAGAYGLLRLGRLVTDSLAFADALGTIADKIGVNVEFLQEYRFAASRFNVDQGTVDTALQRFTRRLGEAAQGTGVLLDPLRQYGIAVTDAEGRTRRTEDVLRDYADAVRGARDPQEQLRLAFRAFDSEGAALVNLLREGSEGFDTLAQRARRLGIVLDEELVRGAGRAQQQLKDLRQILSVNISAAVLRNADAIETLTTKLIGFTEAALRAIVGPSVSDLAAIDAAIASAEQRLERLQRFAERRGTNAGLADAIADVERLRALREEALELQRRAAEESAAPEPLPPPPGINLAAVQADLQAAGTLLQDEVKRIREGLDAELEAGTIGLAAYFRRRAEIELAVLDQTIAQRRNALALADEEIQRLRDTGKETEGAEGRRKQLVAEVIVLERQRGDVAVAAARDQAKAEAELAQQREAFEQRLLEVEGRSREARIRALDIELEGYRKLLLAQGEAAEFVERRLARFRETTVLRLDFDQVTSEARAALDELDLVRGRIRADAEAGLITQFQAEKQILALEQERVVALLQIATRARAAAEALGDPAAILAAEQLTDQVRQLGASVDTVTRDLARLDEGAQDAFRGSLQDVLSGLGREITSVSDAVTAFAQNFVQQIQNIAAEIISRRATFALLNALGGSFFNFGSSGGGPGGFAAGGLVRGPGTGTSDSIPAYLSDREYVVRSNVVAQPGMLEFLEHLNSGGLRRMPRFSGSIPRFAAGGLVDASQLGGRQAAGAGITIQQTIVTPDPQRFRAAEGRIAAETGNAIQIATNRNR